MSKRPKPKVKGNAEVKSDGKAKHLARNYIQMAAAEANKGFHEMGIQTPWEAQKAKRLANRIRNGKTYSNWFKSQTSSKPRPNSSNTVTGLEKQVAKARRNGNGDPFKTEAELILERDPYDARESYGLR